MADEFPMLTSQFAQYGANYCANVRKLIPTPEIKKVAAIYESGVTAAMAGLSELLMEQYNALPDDQKEDLNRFVRISGVLPMLDKANATIGARSNFSIEGVMLAARLFPKIKDLIRKFLGIEKDSWTDTILDWIDRIIDNLTGLLPPPTPPKTQEHTQPRPPVPQPQPPMPKPDHSGGIAPVPGPDAPKK